MEGSESFVQALNLFYHCTLWEVLCLLGVFRSYVKRNLINVELEYGPFMWYTLSGKKFIGLKFSKSRTGSDVRYSCHHNSSRFTFPTLAQSWRFSLFHSLQSINQSINQSITPLIY